jgi:hypothetical protein
MARVSPPDGYSSWNVYIEAQADASLDQSRAARMLIKRDIKLGDIAETDRQAGGDTTKVSYREYNVYNSPGTVSPTIAHPWEK